MSRSPDYNAVFTAIARASLAVTSLNASRGIQAPTLVRGVASSYGTPPTVAEGSARALASFQTAGGNLAQTWVQQATDGLIEAMDAVGPLPSRDITEALKALKAAMIRDRQTVRSSNTTLNWIADSSDHGVVAFAGRTSDALGNPCASAFPETLLATYASGAITLTGQRAAPNVLDPSWPMGSGASVLVPVVSASDAPNRRGSQQLLQDGEFDLWAGGSPSSWRVLANPEAISQGVPDYSGFDSLQFTGDGYSKPCIAQIFGADTPATVSAGSLLAWNIFARVSTRPSTGILEIALLDTSGKIATGADGFPCSKRLALAGGLDLWGYAKWGRGKWGSKDGLGAWGRFAWGRGRWGADISGPFVSFSGMFSVPDPLPPSLQFAIRLAEPISSGVTLQLDKVAACVPTSLYGGGPSVAFFAGDTTPDNSYTASLVVQPDMAGGMNWAFERLFRVSFLGLAPLPASASPTAGASVASVLSAFSSLDGPSGGPGGGWSVGGASDIGLGGGGGPFVPTDPTPPLP